MTRRLRIRECIARAWELFQLTWALPFKFACQRIGLPRTPQVYITSTEGWRYPVFLAHCLTAVTVIECHRRDVAFYLRVLRPRDFLCRVFVRFGAIRSSIAIENKVPAENNTILHRVQIDDGFWTAREDDHKHVLPYFAHPNFYQAGLDLAAPGMRDRSRLIRIFFSGTVDRITYTERFEFPILDRATIIDFVREEFGAQVAMNAAPGNPAAVRPIQLMVTCDVRDTTAKHRFSPGEYLDVLSRTEFVLAPPGYRVPTCHNLIEAMSVGAIPITNYAECMFPPMQHGVNCLTFSSLDGLRSAIQTALTMSTAEAAELRCGVVAFYETFLAREAVGRALLQRLPQIRPLVVNAEK